MTALRTHTREEVVHAAETLAALRRHARTFTMLAADPAIAAPVAEELARRAAVTRAASNLVREGTYDLLTATAWEWACAASIREYLTTRRLR
jgi:hypothetical protein